LNDLTQEIRTSGGIARPIAMDVQDPHSVTQAVTDVRAKFGRLDSLVANAGVATAGSTLDFCVEDFDRVQSINLRGAFLLAREAAKTMIADGRGGRILFIASIGAHTILPGLAAYCASKAALVMLGKCLAREWASEGICVNTLCPGYMPTEMNEAWFETTGGKRMIQTFPRHRLMPLEALDEQLLFLTSPRAQHTTGAVITIDDAQSL
jgi:NAD(P)-dependent dehydrogenase (short-subunit alcohol dehydrogenase family)